MRKTLNMLNSQKKKNITIARIDNHYIILYDTEVINFYYG
jgi:hypothetical protein